MFQLTIPHISLARNQARELLLGISITINLLTEAFYLLHFNMFPAVQELPTYRPVW